MKMVGLGSQYAFCRRDEDGRYFDGSKTYRLRIPPNVPAKDFWCIVVYAPQTRSLLPTGQQYPSINSRRNEGGIRPQPAGREVSETLCARPLEQDTIVAVRGGSRSKAPAPWFGGSIRRGKRRGSDDLRAQAADLTGQQAAVHAH